MYRIAMLTNQAMTRTVKVYRDPEWEQFQVRLWEKGPSGVMIERTKATYHTGSRSDAMTTAQYMCLGTGSASHG